LGEQAANGVFYSFDPDIDTDPDTDYHSMADVVGRIAFRWG
jgi:hypothetical protein